MARIGKIARLPLETREELNRRLANGELGGSLLRWLNGLPAVRDMLEYCFGAAAITKQNLSEWRKGGFREWKMRLEFFSDPVKVAAQAREIREVSGDKLTHNLATVLAGQYAVVMRRWFAYPTQEVEARLRVLHGLCVDIVALRRRDIEVERMKLDLERWEFDREQILRKMALLERKRAEAQGESKLVQAKNLHRRDEEKRRDCGVGEKATERDFISRSGPNAEAVGVCVGATLPSRYGSQSRAPATEGGRGESKLVQAFFFEGAGSGVRTATGTGGYARSAGSVPNRYMRDGRASRLRSRHASAAASDCGNFIYRVSDRWPPGDCIRFLEDRERRGGTLRRPRRRAQGQTRQPRWQAMPAGIAGFYGEGGDSLSGDLSRKPLLLSPWQSLGGSDRI